MKCSRLNAFIVWYENGEEFHRIKREIFNQHCYFFESRSRTPMIVDVGAHIGLSVLYFKTMFPQARILALEPFSQNFSLLAQNVSENRLSDVALLPVAVGSSEGKRVFYVDKTQENWYSSGSFLPHAWNNQQKTRQVVVDVKKLSDILPREVDLLKVDAEGAEEEILLELGSQIRRIKEIICEFHPAYGKTPQKIEQFLQKHGFRVVFRQKGKEVSWQKTSGLLMLEASKV